MSSRLKPFPDLKEERGWKRQEGGKGRGKQKGKKEKEIEMNKKPVGRSY